MIRFAQGPRGDYNLPITLRMLKCHPITAFTNSFPICSARRVLYISLYVIVLYYVIPVTISCKSSYGGNKDKEKKEGNTTVIGHLTSYASSESKT